MLGVEAIRQRDRLFSVLREGGQVFVRPTGCHKIFVGQSDLPGLVAKASALAAQEWLLRQDRLGAVAPSCADGDATRERSE